MSSIALENKMNSTKRSHQASATKEKDKQEEEESWMNLSAIDFKQ